MTEPENTYEVDSNTQMVFRSLEIGVGNIWEAEYLDEAGTQRTGITARLWISIDGNTNSSLDVRVYPGQIIRVDNYEIRVLEIKTTDRTPSVTLNVNEVLN